MDMTFYIRDMTTTSALIYMINFYFEKNEMVLFEQLRYPAQDGFCVGIKHRSNTMNE